MTNPTAAAPEPYLCGGERAAAHGAHYIEETVRVYLMRDLAGTDTWVIDPTCFGDALPTCIGSRSRVRTDGFVACRR